MHVYVTVELCQGVLAGVRAYASKKAARDAERRWLCKQRISNTTSREAKAADGAEFHVSRAEVQN